MKIATSRNQKDSPDNSTNVHYTFADAVSEKDYSVNERLPYSNSASNSALKKPEKTPPSRNSPSHSDPERKYNLIVQGIVEYPHGPDVQERKLHDLEKASETISSVLSSVDSSSIRDVYRLGKYIPNHERPRPLLVKLIRATDVSVILSKKSSLPRHIFIRPDMTKEERARHKTLMQER